MTNLEKAGDAPYLKGIQLISTIDNVGKKKPMYYYVNMQCSEDNIIIGWSYRTDALDMLFILK